MEEQIKILNDERLRLVEGVKAGILSSESVNERMLEINKIIENMIKNKDKNPFDKMFPGQSLTETGKTLSNLDRQIASGIGRTMSDMDMSGRTMSNKDQHPMPDGTIMPGIDHAAYEANRNMMNKGGEASFPDLTGDGKVTQADILKGRGVKMANGGEIDMALEDVSRGTMDMQTQPTQEEVSMVQQIMESVMQMVAQGASEEEIVMALQQMGLDQEDIAMVMQVVAQQMQAQPAQEDAIGAELSQMM